MSSIGRTQLTGAVLLTFRELWSTWITLGLFAVATIGWLLMSFAMNMDVVEGSISALRIFGFESTPTTGVRDPETGEWVQQAVSLDKFVVGIQSFVFGASYFLGTLLGVFATAPLTAGLMAEPRIGLLLSKPVGRSRFLAGHVLAVVLTVLALASYLVVSVWLVLSIKTGIWNPAFLLAIPTITVMFSVIYGVVMLLAVGTGSSGAALIAAYGLVFFSMVLAGHEGIVAALSSVGQTVFMTIYYVLPNFIEVIPAMVQLVEGKPVETWVPLTSSIVFGVACYLVAGSWFVRKDF